MKICYLCCDSGIPILGRKGCSTHVRETARALQQAGHKVFVLTPNRGTDDQGNDDIEIIETPPFMRKWMGSDLRHWLYNWRVINKARTIFQQYKPDVIYERYSLYSTVGMRLAAEYGLPRILEVNSFLVQEQRTRLHFPRIAQILENRVLLNAPSVIVVSKPLKDSFIKKGVEPERIVIMPMAVDVATFTPDVEPRDIKGELGIPREHTIVGYVGTLTDWHGIDLLFDVAKILKSRQCPVHIVVIGGDTLQVQQNRVVASEQGLKDHIHFMGSVSYQLVPNYIKALDFTLISGSHTWASPTKLFEYQAIGKAAIAPRLIPVEEALTHGEEGLLFEPGNVEEIVDCITRLHQNPEEREKMGREARARVVQTRAWECNTSQIIDMFEKMLETNRHDRSDNQ
ncbi:glycosyltransferase family 4 protein [Candidatus Sumerlaeota bacterium]|nr:glycosyltransferase family 4 protein [Candidatus Sumerlaeota bacterium]